MAVRITIISEPIPEVKIYATSDLPAQQVLFNRLLRLLMESDGPVFMEGDFECTLYPRLDHSLVSPPFRHDSSALRRLLGRARLSDIIEGAMKLAEK